MQYVGKDRAVLGGLSAPVEEHTKSHEHGRDRLTLAESGDTTSGPGGTVQHVPSPDGTVDYAPSDAGGTLDHPTIDAGGTLDHLSRQQGSGPALPRSVAGYEILGVLGRGAMGVVYKARQPGLKRLVALKMILSGEHASERDLGRFRSEAEAVAQLQHPNIVQVFEVGEDGGCPFLALEYVDGTSLDKKVRGTPLAPLDAARMAQTLAEAMDHAHQHGIIHRDLKPANILLTAEGTPKVGDFGLAKRIEEDAGQTRSGTILGTPSYMAPEQAEGRIHDVGPLADVYSLGAILYELLTGRPPFRAATILDTLHQLRTQEPVAPTQFQPKVPRDLETICLKCLEKDKAKRYASAGALAADLRRFVAGEPIEARPIGSPERAWRWCRRNPGKAIPIALASLVVVGWVTSASLLAWSLKVSRDAMRNALVAAVEAKDEAKKSEDKALQNEKRAKETADHTIKGMVDLGGKLHGRLQSKRLSIGASPEVKRLREDVLAELRQSLAEVGKKIEEAGTTTFGQLATSEQMGDLLVKLGQVQEAKRAYDQGRKKAEQIVAAEPDNDVARANLGVLLLKVGSAILEMDGDARSAHSHYSEARRLHAEILAKPLSNFYSPADIKRILSHDDIHLAEALLALGRPAEAEKYSREALDYREEWAKAEPRNATPRSYIVEARMWLGTTAWHRSDPKGVREHFGKALEIGVELVKEFPKYPPFEADLAEVQGAHGDALLRLGRPADAEKSYRESLTHLQAVIDQNPDDLSRQPLLALTHERLGAASRLLGKQGPASEHCKQAIRLRGELLQLENGNPARKMAYLLALAHADKQAEAATFLAKVGPGMTKSPVLLMQVARCWALCASGKAPGKEKCVRQALDALGAATRDGYKDAVALETDPDLAPLREDAAFRALIAEIEARK